MAMAPRAGGGPAGGAAVAPGTGVVQARRVGPDGLPRARGLVTALTGLVTDLPDAVWVCAATSEEDAAVAAEHGGKAVECPRPRTAAPRPGRAGAADDAPTMRLRLVEVEQRAHDDFYTVIANPLLWFLGSMCGLALAPALTKREHAAWTDGYVAVNRQFADAVVEEVEARRPRPGDAPRLPLLPGRPGDRERCPGVALVLPAHPLAGPGRLAGAPGLARAAPQRAARQRRCRLPHRGFGTSCSRPRSCSGCRSTWRR